MRFRTAIVGAALAAAALLAAVPAPSQDRPLTVGDADTVKTVLERSAGKRITVMMLSGQELTGAVTRVTGNVVHLSELAGREFSDAVVSLDRVSAVIVRVRGR